MKESITIYRYTRDGILLFTPNEQIAALRGEGSYDIMHVLI